MFGSSVSLAFFSQCLAQAQVDATEVVRRCGSRSERVSGRVQIRGRRPRSIDKTEGLGLVRHALAIETDTDVTAHMFDQTNSTRLFA